MVWSGEGKFIITFKIWLLAFQISRCDACQHHERLKTQAPELQTIEVKDPCTWLGWIWLAPSKKQLMDISTSWHKQTTLRSGSSSSHLKISRQKGCAVGFAALCSGVLPGIITYFLLLVQVNDKAVKMTDLSNISLLWRHLAINFCVCCFQVWDT